MDGIKEEAVGFLYNLEVTVEEEAEEAAAEPLGEAVPVEEEHHRQIMAKGLEAPKAPAALSYSAPSETGDAERSGSTATATEDPYTAVGRNDLCPCGSGKKFKRCHGAPGGPSGLIAERR
jgi:preprotein translocase subunit SecA